MSISIIIPAYNAADFLRRSVDSVISQEYENYQVIIVDDGSTDQTAAIADQLAAENDRIQVIHQRNGGVSAARNAGLASAAGDYVLFLDADDALRPGLFEAALGGGRNPECVLYGFDYLYADHTEENLPSISSGDHLRDEVMASFWNLYRDGVLSNIGTKIYKREILVEHQIRFNEQATILEDVSFFLATLQYVHEVTVLGQSYYSYYMDANASSIQKRYRPRYGEHLNAFFHSAMKLSVPIDQDLYLIYMDAILLVLKNDLLDPNAGRKDVMERYRGYMDYPLVMASQEHIGRSDVRPMKYLFYQMLWNRHPGILYDLTVLWSKVS